MNQTLPLADYGLASARVSVLVGHGAINQVYKVESAAGVFVLKEYSGIPMDTARFSSCATFRPLRTAGLPIPKVRQTSDGRASAIQWPLLPDDYVAGHTFPGGNMPDEAAFRLGVTHAKLLSLLAAIPGATPQELPDLESTEAHLRALLAIGSKRRGQDARDEASCLQLEQKLRMLQAWQGPAPKVRAQWTHGDYTWRNVLFDGDDEVAAIVDFDNLRSSDRGRDVMRCFTLSFPHGSPAARSYFGGYAAASGSRPRKRDDTLTSTATCRFTACGP
jgi:aminoglycoside phosphotransferase (APT) family kinase protein